MESLGKIAYEAYGEARGWTTFAGEPMLSWGLQTDDLRAAWEAAAQAVAAALGG